MDSGAEITVSFINPVTPQGKENRRFAEITVEGDESEFAHMLYQGKVAVP